MNKEEIIKELDKQNRKLGEELSLTKDRLNKEKFEKEHYKKLYSEIKKQKDDVVEYIKYQLSNLDFYKEQDMKAKMLGTMILVMLEDKRMLGEIDEIR